MTVAAKATAEKKAFGHRSSRLATRRAPMDDVAKAFHHADEDVLSLHHLQRSKSVFAEPYSLGDSDHLS